MRVLVVNAGSSSLKLRVLDKEDRLEATTDLPIPRGAADAAALEAAVSGFGPLQAVGHRIVHGGTAFVGPVLVDPAVRSRLSTLVDLAPLHQPRSLAALDAVSQVLPEVPAVACFDTAFHADLPAAAATYALPREWRARWHLRRYGFHGLSHAYVARRAAQLVPSPAPLRLVSCHLGAGASLAAISGERSMDTTMGFTPLEGLVMATRSGTVDPGLVLWLEEHVGTPPAELAATLEHRSGLLGLAGSPDMPSVLRAAHQGDPDALLALDVYLHRLRSAIAAMTASLGGLDALVFTGGVGQNSPEIRARAAQGLAYLGISLDPSRNQPPDPPVLDPPDRPGPPGAGGEHDPPDRDISASGAPVRTLVLSAREDLQIAQEVRSVLSA